jgi:dTDP-glucose 4,6-dehydratase
VTTTNSRRILITGGAGFVGSHLVEAFSDAYPDHLIVVLDKMSYAADDKYIEPHTTAGRAHLVVGDIRNARLVDGLMDGVELLIHAAAESHVDRSFGDSYFFSDNNVLGTHVVMEAARKAKVPLTIHVSTDEVYGTIKTGAVDELASFDPTNPYAASKAAAEMVVGGYRHSFKLPVIVVRANNMYGRRQFPEKLIPHCLMALIDGEPIKLHGDGTNTRHYLSAEDFADALVLLSRQGTVGETYNIGTSDSYSNNEIALMICDEFGREFGNDTVVYIDDRPFNDLRYSVSSKKIAALGWSPKRRLSDDLPMIAEWYRDHADVMRARVHSDPSNFLTAQLPLPKYWRDFSAAHLLV